LIHQGAVGTLPDHRQHDVTEEYMLTVKACLRSDLARKMRGLASLVPILVLAILLASLLPSQRVLSLFQSPTSPLPTTEAEAPPTEVPLSTAVTPVESPPPGGEVPLAETPPPTEIRPTAASPAEQAPPTLTAAVPSSEGTEEPTPSSTQVALLPAVEVAARPTDPAAAELPERDSPRLWPWILLGAFSIGAIAAGVFLLQREVPAQEE